MVRKRDRIGLWRRAQIDDATERQPFQPFGGVAAMNLQRLLAAGIAHDYEALAIMEPTGEPVAGAVVIPMLEHRAFPVAHRETFAACCQREQMTLRMRREAFEILRRSDELAVALRTRAVVGHFDLARRTVEDKQISAGMIDDAATVRGGMPDVEIFVVRVAAQVFTGRCA